MIKNYLLELTPVTPVIVGSGEELEGYEYVIDSTERVLQVNALNTYRVVSLLQGKDLDEFTSLLESDVVKLRQFLQKRSGEIIRNPELIRFKFVTTESVKEICQDKVSDDRNQLSIGLAPRSGTTPYLPGSSIKGAIRTALLYEEAISNSSWQARLRSRVGDLKSKELGKRAGKYLEACIFNYKEGNTYADPLRNLAVGDSSPANTYAVLTQVIALKQKQWSYQAKAIKEAIQRSKSDSENKLYCSLRLKGTLSRDRSTFYPVSKSKIIQSCRKFYSRVLELDKEIASQGFQPLPVDWFWYEKAKGAFEGDDKDSFPLRVGWGGGMLSSTLALLRNTKLPRSRRYIIAKEGLFFPIGWLIARLTEKNGD
jgi:CRISPR-associated protein Csm5